MIRSLMILIPLALVFAGCGGDADKTDGDADGGKQPDKHDVHDHAAKHGGELLELGAHEGFLEVKMDHDKGQVTIWAYLGEAMTDAKLGAAPVFNFKSGDKPMQLEGTANADGSWVFSDESLKGEPEGARFRIVVGGKTYSPEWAHSHDHDHDHDEHEGHDHDEDEHDHGHDHDGDDG